MVRMTISQTLLGSTVVPVPRNAPLRCWFPPDPHADPAVSARTSPDEPD